jgi:hypothetical protein
MTLGRPPHRARGGHDLLIRRYLYGHPESFRSVRDLGCLSPPSDLPAARSALATHLLRAPERVSDLLARDHCKTGLSRFPHGRRIPWEWLLRQWSAQPIACDVVGKYGSRRLRICGRIMAIAHLAVACGDVRVVVGRGDGGAGRACGVHELCPVQ